MYKFTDIINNATPTQMMNNLGLVISDLKSMKQDMNISVCKLVPSPRDDLRPTINELNDKLKNLSSMKSVINLIDCF